MFDLSGKRALVTGASGGIGREIAKALAASGARVALSGTPILPTNLSDLDAVDKLVPSAEAALGGLDILVNNAGVTRDNLFMRMKNEEWDEVLAVNLTSAFHLTRAVLRGMMKQRFGRIIGITSVVGVVGNPGQGNYAASKAGLIGMSKALAYEVASRNITVNTVAPGFIGSAMTD
jgi:3-oxoacyl-[acyl-carrier protein] reductase